MKKASLLFIVLFAALVSCETDTSEENQSGEVSFSMNVTGVNASGGRVKENAPPAFVMLSISSKSGDVVVADKKIPLYAFGGGYVSEDIHLTTGTYQLLKFIVLDAENKSIYASPIAGSALAKVVAHPLPIEFSISANAATQVVPEVIKISDILTPNLFGYANFGFSILQKRTVNFELFTTANFSNETHVITFKASIKDLSGTDKILWDSTFSEIPIKDIPSVLNKIKFSKTVYTNSQLRIGFDYYIKDCCLSWYYQYMQQGEVEKTVSYDFQ